MCISVVLLISSCVNCQNIIITMSNGVKIEIAPNSLEKLIYNDAIIYCEKLGNGWRLPNKDEIREMGLNKSKLGVLFEGCYWTSSICGGDGRHVFVFSDLYLGGHAVNNDNWVRPVRDYNDYATNSTPNNSQTSTNSTTTNSPAADRFSNNVSSNSSNGTSSSIASNTSNSNIDSPCNVKSANIDDIESCNSCRGTGQVTKQSSSVCPNCESWNSEYKSKVACHVCKDTRKNPNIKTWKETCSGCKGSGRDYEQEKRNRDFGGYDQRLVKGTYNGTYGNIEYKSISIEQRRSGGIQTEFDYSKWSTGCSCLGSEWTLPNRGELVLIMKDLQSNGVHGDGKYATNETTIQGGDKYIYLVNFGQSVLPETKKLSSDPTINDNYWHGLHCKVICIKRK